jgi:hypothetical protein
VSTGRRTPSEAAAASWARCATGSYGTVHYLANGHKGFPKERLELLTDGQILQLDNFRRLRAWEWKGAGDWSLRQDRGQKTCIAAFREAARHGCPSPIPFNEIMEVPRVSVALADAARGW